MEKPPFLPFSNAANMCIPRLCKIVQDCAKATLQALIRGKVDINTIIDSDGWRGYNGLVDLGYGHFRVDHFKDEFAHRHVHINGIEGFWGVA